MLYEISKDDLEIIRSLDTSFLGIDTPTGLTISHYAGSWMSVEASLVFTFEGVEEFTPYVKEVDFYIVSRQRIDLTAVGQNEQIIEDNRKDIGKYSYKNTLPPTLDLPPGFTELYRG
jgi:hypothetical protein